MRYTLEINERGKWMSTTATDSDYIGTVKSYADQWHPHNACRVMEGESVVTERTETGCWSELRTS